MTENGSAAVNSSEGVCEKIFNCINAFSDHEAISGYDPILGKKVSWTYADLGSGIYETVARFRQKKIKLSVYMASKRVKPMPQCWVYCFQVTISYH